MGSEVRTRCTAIVVGIDKWSRTTEKFYKSFRYFEPTMPLVIVDNQPLPRTSYPHPPEPCTWLLRTGRFLGYNEALNLAMSYWDSYRGEPDWYLCFNNDCRVQGELSSAIDVLDPMVFYGSKINPCEEIGRPLLWSAWMAISRQVRAVVGDFDPMLTHGFEDFDYQLRAIEAGFELGVADLPVLHLDKHTRFAVQNYFGEWDKSRLYFSQKHGVETKPW